MITFTKSQLSTKSIEEQERMDAVIAEVDAFSWEYSMWKGATERLVKLAIQEDAIGTLVSDDRFVKAIGRKAALKMTAIGVEYSQSIVGKQAFIAKQRKVLSRAFKALRNKI